MGRRTASSSGAVGGGDDAGLSSCDTKESKITEQQAPMCTAHMPPSL